MLTPIFCHYTQTSVGFGLRLVPLFGFLFCFVLLGVLLGFFVSSYSVTSGRHALNL